MTLLIKPVRRQTDIEIHSGTPTSFTITLYPEGTIGFREKGHRAEFLLDLRSAYLLAAQKAAVANRINKPASRRS